MSAARASKPLIGSAREKPLWQKAAPTRDQLDGTKSALPAQAAAAPKDGPSPQGTVPSEGQPDKDGSAQGTPDHSGGGVDPLTSTNNTAVPNSGVAILAARPFVIKTYLINPGADAASTTTEVTASVLSKTLDATVLSKSPGADASLLTLGVIRKLIPPMSRFARIHKFCSPSGMSVNDETISLGDYLALEPASGTESGGVASVNIYYRSPAANPQATMASADVSTAAPAINTQMSQAPSGKTATLAAVDLTASYQNVPIATKSAALSAGNLTEAQWAMVLRNCAVFYGWVVDPKSKAVRRAPKPAFRLRSSASDLDASQSAAPSYGNNNSAATQPAETSGTAAAHPNDSQSQAPSTVSQDGATSTVIQQPMAQQNAPQDNSAQQTEAQSSSPTPLAQAQNTGSSSAATGTAQGTDEELELPSERTARLAKTDAAQDVLNRQAAEITPTSIVVGNIPPKDYNAIPNFRVNDDSKIDITICKHELSMSMAKNDFSSQSTEASVSGGAMGITAGVSAGYASSKSTGHSDQSTEGTSQMVARYMYPRCDLFLTSGDLEPTPELATLLETIHTTKSLRALRRLQADYGQLFCQQLTLGARLLSMQTMSTRFKGSEDEQKEQFKVSVGVSVSTPYGGASVKHEEEKGHSTETKQSETSSNESNVFEAVGGDTILANNPNAWALSVSSPDTWRVINRDGLTSLVEMLSEMPGYAAVQSWFVQAVPALSKYLTLDDSHTVTCRFNVQSPNNSLHIRNENGKARHYLGFQGDTVSPCLNTTNTTIIDGVCQDFWVRLDSTVEKRLFEPQTYRAPVLRGFDNYDVQGSKYGASFNDAFAAVTWDIIAPFTDVLSHGARVIIRTKPSEPKTSPTHMVVFRNAQGHFVPGMSDRDEYQYWRMLKVGSSQSGEPIQAGDEVRLCWSFEDQTTGYRDYVGDVFGRRQTNAPNGYTDVLYLKVPWPRFENSGHPTALVMCNDGSTASAVMDLNTAQGQFKYAIQDLSFRLDTVENAGHGDADDYLLREVNQEGDKTISASLTIHTPGNVFQMQQKMWLFGIGG